MDDYQPLPKKKMPMNGSSRGVYPLDNAVDNKSSPSKEDMPSEWAANTNPDAVLEAIRRSRLKNGDENGELKYY